MRKILGLVAACAIVFGAVALYVHDPLYAGDGKAGAQLVGDAYSIYSGPTTRSFVWFVNDAAGNALTDTAAVKLIDYLDWGDATTTPVAFWVYAATAFGNAAGGDSVEVALQGSLDGTNYFNITSADATYDVDSFSGGFVYPLGYPTAWLRIIATPFGASADSTLDMHYGITFKSKK